MTTLTAAPTTPTPAAAPPSATASIASPACYTAFRQGGWGYLLPAAAVVGIVGAEHLRPLAAPVAGWAGTLAMRGGALPVLDAAALFGHGGRGRAIAIVQTEGGPLGLAIEQVSGRQALDDAPLVPLAGAPGITGGVVAGDQVLLALAPQHLAALRSAAIARDAAGQPTPQPVTWTSAGATDAAPPASPSRSAPRVGDAVLVLGDRAAADPACCLALPLSDVRAVARTGPLRPGLPGAPAIVGYRSWGRLPVPAVDLGALGLTAPLAPRAPAQTRSDRDYAVLVAVTTARATLGIAVLSAGARGVQRLEEASAPTGPDNPAVVGRGQTAAAQVTLLSPAGLAATIGVPDLL